jgi:MinD-like ATPase involved in chromosome partitioning or flagellar assembly
MPSNFDLAVADLVATSESVPGFDKVRRAVAVRDLRGRMRLVLDAPSEGPNLDDLNHQLGQRLGRWFHGPAITTAQNGAAGKLAREVLDRATSWPGGWPQSWTDPTGAPHAVPSRWLGYQRVLSKQAWLEGSRAGPSQPLRAGEPVIVAFYSFKGGVGRTTLLGVLAWQLAQSGRRVVCIDLDVEAPGLSAFLDVQGEPSVLDCLLGHAATGTLPAEDPVQATNIHGVTVHVVPAGVLGRTYLEKLARLDYLGATSASTSPIAEGLSTLLKRVSGQHRPDFIFLDCRAGLHDLGGLSLHDLAHVDVLVGRDTPQGRDGLALTLEVLRSHREPPDRLVLIAQTFVPLPLDGPAASLSRNRFRRAMFEVCERTLYADLDDVPAEDDTQVAHFPWPIGHLDELAVAQRLEDISVGTHNSPAFQEIRRRLEALAGSEATEDAELYQRAQGTGPSSAKATPGGPSVHRERLGRALARFKSFSPDSGSSGRFATRSVDRAR